MWRLKMSKRILLSKELLYKYYVEDFLPVNQILEIFNICQSTLFSNLRHYNIKLRHKIVNKNASKVLTKEFLEEQFINLNKSGMEIAKEFCISKSDVYRFLDLYDIKKDKNNRNLQLAEQKYNTNILEENTPFFWYFLGFFFGDGTVICRPEARSYQLRFSQGESSLPVLNHFKELIGGNIYLSKRHRGDKIFYQYDYVINSKYLVDLFINKYNIQPNKTNDLHFPEFMDYNYFNYFLRGYLDSDGNIYSNKEIGSYNINFASNSIKFLVQIQDIIFKLLNVDSFTYKRKSPSNCYVLYFNGKKRKALGEYIYQDILSGNPQTCYLDYKYQKFLKFL